MSYYEKINEAIFYFKNKNPKYEKIIEEFKKIESMCNREFDTDNEREYLLYKKLDEILNDNR
jgi:hypothetical protein